jgi:polyferredoxin
MFGQVFWPQDLVFLAGFLVLGACLVFFMSTLVGRAWCGFGCPHTVYSTIFHWIERRTEGGRSARMRLDREPMSMRKFSRKALKHAGWFAVSLWTGVTLSGYFTPMPELLREIGAFSLGLGQLSCILLYGGLCYLKSTPATRSWTRSARRAALYGMRAKTPPAIMFLDLEHRFGGANTG